MNGRVSYDLTPEGVRALTRRGVDTDAARNERRLFAYSCPDWTERRPHLGGALGAAMLQGLQDAGIMRRAAASRAVTILRPIVDWFDARDRTAPLRPRQIQRKGRAAA